MAQDGFKAAVEVLDSEGKNFQSVGKSFGDALDRLEKGLTAIEGTGTPPWGDDELGQDFGVVYEGLRDGMYESMGHLSIKLSDVGQALRDMGANHEANEDYNSALMGQQRSHADEQGQQIAQLRSPDIAT